VLVPDYSQWELSTVSDDEVVAHRPGAGSAPAEVLRRGGLAPDSDYDFGGLKLRTLPRPDGELLARVTTANDVHVGENGCGIIGSGDTSGLGGLATTSAATGAAHTPVLRSLAGETPYPELMSRDAAGEMAALEPDAVVVKGDLTDAGRPEEYTAFLDCYQSAFGDRLVHVRGNHDAYEGQRFADTEVAEVTLPGVILAVLDTTIERSASGQVRPSQLEWLDELGSRADRPVLVFGHHHCWKPGSRRSATYFGIRPEDSEALVAVVARRPRIAGYFAGHTHRNRVRYFAETGVVPYVEVASTKDFPGTWAEYRIFEGGITQVHHRTSTPRALAWSDRCRALYWGVYPSYAFGTLADRCFAIPLR
jgi:3',5'-cyclic AMP phosphodiesterase CpdA